MSSSPRDQEQDVDSSAWDKCFELVDSNGEFFPSDILRYMASTPKADPNNVRLEMTLVLVLPTPHYLQ